MGIPKFYRWLSERYPLLNQKFTATESPPEFDNLYLDMNGIIHNCTHANQKEVKLTEHEMMLRIFDYIDKLVQIIRPQKVLFMAIDGVAPRAKMNQQRSRRFKAAKERMEAQAEKARKGEPVPTDPFDSNCITPGTPFMERLGKHLRFFIRRKMKDDPLWQQPTVIFSGHEVPGEGEHKIMEYLRWEKRSPAYQPNQRHCLYGLDADLIMLSLVTHEPHFCLLREIVSYSGGNKGQPARETLENPCAENFILFHIGLLREYLELEFVGVPVPFEPSGQVDIERVVDDFVLFCMLVGNDFLPALPTLDINEGALNRMVCLYKELLGQSGGYLTYAGELDRRRLELLLAKLGQEEQAVLEERAKDAEYFDAKRAKRAGRENGAGGDAYVIPFRRDGQPAPASNGAAAPVAPKLLTRPANGAARGPPAGQQQGGARLAAGPGPGPGFGGPTTRKGGFNVLPVDPDLPDADTAVAGAANGVGAEAAAGGQAEAEAEGDNSSDSVVDSKPATPPPPELAAFFQVIKAVGVDAALEEEVEVAGVPVPVAAAAVAAEPTMMSREARQLMLSGNAAEGLRQWKARWYSEKLEADTPNKQRRVAECYLEGLHWVLEYYYRGVASWIWYYPYHYAPCASDMVNLDAVKVSFVQGKPFRPFEQLLAVLPAASASLLPPAYQPLMLDPASPIIDFYPATFEVDMEGKRAEWEGVVKVPWVDEERLLSTVTALGDKALSEDERARNLQGEILVFMHNRESRDTDYCGSTMPQLFRDITAPNSRLLRRKMPPPLPADQRGFQPVLVASTTTGLDAPRGYPTLKSIRVKASLRPAGINVLGTPSRKESLLLQVPDLSGSTLTAAGLAPMVLGKRCYVNWPYLQEASVLRVSDAQEQWYLTSHSQPQGKKWQSQEASKWQTEGAAMAGALLTKHGLEVGKVQLMLHVRVCRGFLRHTDGTLEKQYAQDEVVFPLQCVLRARPGAAPTATEDEAEEQPPAVEIKEGDKVIFLGKTHYGCVATILPGTALTKQHHTPATPLPSYRIQVQPLGPAGQDPGARPARQAATNHQARYFASHEVARKLRINPRVLGRITSNVWVTEGDERHDVGLAVRAPSKGLCVPGFASPSPDGQGWQYSAVMMDVLHDYKVAHPWVYEVLDKHAAATEHSEKGGGGLRLAEFLPDVSPADRKALVTAAVKWVKACPLAAKPLVKTSVVLLPDEGVKMLQMAMPQLAPPPPVEYENVPPALLLPAFTPGPEQVKFSVQGGAFSLGDRVVCLLKAGLPPFGIHGTVIGIFDDAVEVFFDREFPGGTNLGGKLNTRSGAYVPKDILLNLSRPTTLPLNKSQVPRPVSAPSAPHSPPTHTAKSSHASRPASGAAARAQVPGAVASALNTAAPAGSAATATAATAGGKAPSSSSSSTAREPATGPPGVAPPPPSATMMAHAGGAAGRGGRGGRGGGPRHAGRGVERSAPPAPPQAPAAPPQAPGAGRDLLDKLLKGKVMPAASAPQQQPTPPVPVAPPPPLPGPMGMPFPVPPMPHHPHHHPVMGHMMHGHGAPMPVPMHHAPHMRPHQHRPPSPGLHGPHPPPMLLPQYPGYHMPPPPPGPPMHMQPMHGMPPPPPAPHMGHPMPPGALPPPPPPLPAPAAGNASNISNQQGPPATPPSGPTPPPPMMSPTMAAASSRRQQQLGSSIEGGRATSSPPVKPRLLVPSHVITTPPKAKADGQPAAGADGGQPSG